MANHYRETERILIQAVRDTVGRLEEIMGQQQQQANDHQQQELGDINADQHGGGDGDFDGDFQQQEEQVQDQQQAAGQQQPQQVEQQQPQQGGQQQTEQNFGLWLRGCDMEEQCESCRRLGFEKAKLHHVQFEKQ